MAIYVTEQDIETNSPRLQNYYARRAAVGRPSGTYTTASGVPVGPGATGPNPAPYGDARARMEASLREYGLESLTAWAYDMLIQGYSEPEIAQLLYERPEFKQRFPAIFERREAGLAPISVDEYITYERSARQLMRAVGFPPSFYDSPDDFHDLLIKDVSLKELSDRIDNGFVRVFNAPPQVRAAFDEYFGYRSDAALAALYLDPEKATPILEQMAAAAEAGGYAKGYGFDIGAERAMTIGKMDYSRQELFANFAELEQRQPLLRETVSEDRDITDDQALEAQFGLGSQGVREQMRKRLQERNAAFGGRSQAYITETGTGLGSADR